MFDIVFNVEIDAKNKHNLKQTDAELDKIIKDVPALFENQDNINKAFSTLNNSLGEEKNETKTNKAKKAMLDQDPEKYFDGFVKWVEEEEKKLAEERKKLEETDANSEIEYNEEEEQFLNGQINDQQQ